MSFDPIIAAIRFGMGLAPRHALPGGVDDLLGDVSGPDAMADAHVIPSFEAATPSPRDYRVAFKLRQDAQGEAGFAAADARIGQLRLQARLAQLDHGRTVFARLVDAPIGFRERLVTFWADHFTVKSRNGQTRHLVTPYIEDAIRPHVGGRFVDMLIAAESHPMMLLYLQQAESIGPTSVVGLKRGRGLNENLARELLELHTLGVDGGYAQADVRQMAELLSGLTYSPEDGMHYDARRAEPGGETVLGVNYGAEASPAVIQRALADLAAHPATATHLAHKLARHFVADDPDPALVAAIATAYTETDGDLMACYAALLGHPAAWHAAPQKVRPPVDFIAGACRALGVSGAEFRGITEKQAQKWLQNPLRVMGQTWQDPPGPDGWPDRVNDWIIPQTMAGRITWALQVPRVIRDPLPDPRDVVRHALGPEADPAVVFAAGAAETRRDGIGLIFASAAFNRR